MLRVLSLTWGGTNPRGLSSKKFRLNETKLFFLNVECLRGFKSGFSIAEAMIMLLIVSVAMALSAPMISRQMKHNLANSLPAQANSGVCWPDYANGVDVVSIPTTGIVAETDGWVKYYENSSAPNWHLKVNGAMVLDYGQYTATSSVVPVKKGDVWAITNGDTVWTTIAKGFVVWYPCRK